MRRALVTFLLLALLALPTCAMSRWRVEAVLPSLVPLSIELPNGKHKACTAFSIGPGLFVTAGHCMEGKATVEGVPFQVIEEDEKADLAVLQARIALPPLSISQSPQAGEEYLAVGFPIGIGIPLHVPSVFQGDHTLLGKDGSVFVGNSMPGMSGGPIVDRKGGVVSVILAGGAPSSSAQNIGFGARFTPLRKLVRKHLALHHPSPSHDGGTTTAR